MHGVSGIVVIYIYISIVHVGGVFSTFIWRGVDLMCTVYHCSNCSIPLNKKASRSSQILEWLGVFATKPSQWPVFHGPCVFQSQANLWELKEETHVPPSWPSFAGGWPSPLCVQVHQFVLDGSPQWRTDVSVFWTSKSELSWIDASGQQKKISFLKNPP